MSAIFISYRRGDSAGQAGRLYDNLCARFGADQVFMDVDDIHPGEDFVAKLQSTEKVCTALVVVIGKSWLTSRLTDPNDFVRLEIAKGLKSGLHVFPVLVQGSTMPDAKDLPDEITALARLQALTVRDESFQRDAADLIAALSQVVAGPAPASNLWSGKWHASVNYSWGATHDEVFQFEVDDDELMGTASYLKAPRAICEGKITANKATFYTRSLAMLGDKTYEEKHYYSGKLAGDKITFRLLTESGYDSRLPETFTAERLPTQP